MDPFAADDLILAYALLQAVVALLLVRFLDLYEREPIAICALMFLWGAIVAAILASLGNTALQGELPRDVDAVFGPAISAPWWRSWPRASRWCSRSSPRAGRAAASGCSSSTGSPTGSSTAPRSGIGFAFTEDLYYFFREARNSGVERRALECSSTAATSSARRCSATRSGPRPSAPAWAPQPGRGRGVGRIGWPLLGLSAAMLMHAVNNGLQPILLSIKYGFETTYEYLAIGVPVELAERMDASGRGGARGARSGSRWAYVVAVLRRDRALASLPAPGDPRGAGGARSRPA